MGRVIVIVGLIVFFLGVCLYLLNLPSYLNMFVPGFIIGGICITAIGTFIAFDKNRS